MRSEGSNIEGPDSEEGTGHRDSGSDQLDIPQWRVVEAGSSENLCDLFTPILNKLEKIIEHLVKKEIKNVGKNKI